MIQFEFMPISPLALFSRRTPPDHQIGRINPHSVRVQITAHLPNSISAVCCFHRKKPPFHCGFPPATGTECTVDSVPDGRQFFIQFHFVSTLPMRKTVWEKFIQTYGFRRNFCNNPSKIRAGYSSRRSDNARAGRRFASGTPIRAISSADGW